MIVTVPVEHYCIILNDICNKIYNVQDSSHIGIDNDEVELKRIEEGHIGTP